MSREGGEFENRLTRVVGHESEYNVAIRSDHENIPTHWYCWHDVFIVKIEGARTCRRAVNSLEVVPMQMKRMFPRVGTVDDYLHDVALLEHMCVGVVAVYK